MLFYPHFNYFAQKNSQAVIQAVEKLKNRNLPIEQILDEEELLNDMKFASSSQLINYILKDDIISLIDYVIKEPSSDGHKIGYKYPFNAAEILSGDNTSLLDKFFEDSNAVVKDEYEVLDDTVKEKPVEENPANTTDEEVESIVKGVQDIEITSINDQNPENNDNIEKNENAENSENAEKNETEEIPKILNENTLSPSDIPVDKVVQPRYEILDYFLTFLDSDENLNYVLSGYFSKILNSIKYNRPAALIRYMMLSKKESLFRMVHHINRKAIADSLLKIIMLEASELVSDLTLNFENELKYELLEKILDSFDPRDQERSVNICEFFIEGMSFATNSRKFVNLIIKNKSLMEKFFSLCQTHLTTDVGKELLKTMNILTESLMKEIRHTIKDLAEEKNMGMEFEENTPSKPISPFDFKSSPFILDILISAVEPVARDYSRIEEESQILSLHMTFDKNISVLGTKKLLEFDYIYTVLEILYVCSSAKIFELPEERSETYLFQKTCLNLLELNFYSVSVDNFFKYEWNNSFQKSFDDLISIVLSSEIDALYIHILQTTNFLEKIIDISLEEKFHFNSGKFINCGNLAHLIEISYKIFSCSSECVKEILSNCVRWSEFYNNFVDPIRKRFNSRLKYDINAEAGLFKDEFSREITPIKQDVPEFTEKNYIENVRKLAHSYFVQTSTNSMSSDDSLSSESTEENHQNFYDNTYWKVTYSPKDDILSELD